MADGDDSGMNPPEPPWGVVLEVEEETVHLTVARDGAWAVSGGGAASREVRLHLDPLEPGLWLLRVGGRSYLVHTADVGGRRMLHVDGHTLEYRVDSVSRTGGAEKDAGPPFRRDGGEGRVARRGPATSRSGSEELNAPMPGVVAQVLVREGDEVTPGQALVVVEAMKMEHVVRAGRAGTVRRVYVRPGEQVEGGARVAEVGPADPGPGAASC